MADVGARLRASREAKRLSLDAVAASTRVHRRILSAIEQNDASALPPRPYGRGFVRAYARELGLNGDDVVREYFGQFAPAEPPPAPPPERSRPVLELRPLAERLPHRLVGMAAIVALLIGGGWMVSRRTPAPAAPRQEAVGTSGRTAAPPPAAPAARSPTPAPQAALNIVLTAAAPCWVTASADGARVVYRVIQTGERVSLQGSRVVSIRAGNAGALTWTVNGRVMGTFGAAGEVRTTRLTPGSIQVLESSAQD